MLDEFYSGFSADLLEVVLVILLVLVFLVGLWLMYRHLSRREREERDRRAEEHFRELVQEKKLTDGEVTTLEELALFLNSSRKKYMLIQNQSLFNACAEAAIEQRYIPESRISALRVRLGFAGRGYDAPPESSAQIPVGSSVLLIQEGRPSMRGKVLEPAPTFFRVQVETQNRPFAAGTTVEVLYQDNSGLYTFTTPVKGFKNSVLYFAHSERPNRVQRRRYYRRNISLPVFVRPAGTEEKLVESRFLDLGGGGASLENPGTRFRAGDGLELSFHPGTRQALNVVGHVIRTSNRGTVLHITFEHLRETTRDSIYKLLFEEEKRRRGQQRQPQSRPPQSQGKQQRQPESQPPQSQETPRLPQSQEPQGQKPPT